MLLKIYSEFPEFSFYLVIFNVAFVCKFIDALRLDLLKKLEETGDWMY